MLFAYSFSCCGVLRLKDYPCNLTIALGSSTITRLFNDYSRAESRNPHKMHEPPPQNCSAAGVHLCAETAEKPCIKRFSGIEKRHRNSIKITVALWRRTWDSNPRGCYTLLDFQSSSLATRSILQIICCSMLDDIAPKSTLFTLPHIDGFCKEKICIFECFFSKA